MENNNKYDNVNKLDELKGLGLEVYETTTETMLEEMGASFGKPNSCSIVITQKALSL